MNGGQSIGTAAQRGALVLAAAMAATALASGPVSAETLQDALVQAYNTSPRLAAVRARLRATDESVAAAMSGWRPTLTLSGNVGESYVKSGSGSTSARAGTSGFTVNGERTTQPRSATLSLNENIYRGGRTEAAVNVADYNVKSDQALLLDTEQQVLLAAATAYMDVLRDQAVVELNVNNEKVLKRQLDAARDRFQVGEVTRTDVSQAEARLAGAHADLTAAEGALANSRTNYRAVVGSMPGTLQPTQPLAGLPANLKEAAALAGDKAFPVLEAAYIEQAARENVDLIFGELLPLVTVGGSVSDGRDQGQPGAFSKSAALTLNVTVPLYESGSVYARVRQAKEVASQRRGELDQQVRTAVQNATTAWDQLQTARAQLSSFSAQVNSNQIALNGVQQEAQVGQRTVLDVLNAEQELLIAQVNLVRARHDLVIATYSVRSAVGALTARDLKLPVDYYDYVKHYKDTRYRWFGTGIETEDRRTTGK